MLGYILVFRSLNEDMRLYQSLLILLSILCPFHSEACSALSDKILGCESYSCQETVSGVETTHNVIPLDNSKCKYIRHSDEDSLICDYTYNDLLVVSEYLSKVSKGENIQSIESRVFRINAERCRFREDDSGININIIIPESAIRSNSTSIVHSIKEQIVVKEENINVHNTGTYLGSENHDEDVESNDNYAESGIDLTAGDEDSDLSEHDEDVESSNNELGAIHPNEDDEDSDLSAHDEDVESESGIDSINDQYLGNDVDEDIEGGIDLTIDNYLVDSGKTVDIVNDSIIGNYVEEEKLDGANKVLSDDESYKEDSHSEVKENYSSISYHDIEEAVFGDKDAAIEESTIVVDNGYGAYFNNTNSSIEDGKAVLDDGYGIYFNNINSTDNNVGEQEDSDIDDTESSLLDIAYENYGDVNKSSINDDKHNDTVDLEQDEVISGLSTNKNETEIEIKSDNSEEVSADLNDDDVDSKEVTDINFWEGSVFFSEHYSNSLSRSVTYFQTGGSQKKDRKEPTNPNRRTDEVQQAWINNVNEIPDISVDSIIYINDKRWSVWFNGDSYNHDDPEKIFSVKEIEYNRVTLVFKISNIRSIIYKLGNNFEKINNDNYKSSRDDIFINIPEKTLEIEMYIHQSFIGNKVKITNLDTPAENGSRNSNSNSNNNDARLRRELQDNGRVPLHQASLDEHDDDSVIDQFPVRKLLKKINDSESSYSVFEEDESSYDYSDTYEDLISEYSDLEDLLSGL